MSKRKYQQTRRAEQQQQTHLRILDAACDLHREVGPAHTSIKAVANRAKVQRLTVYRHFTDDVSLLQAAAEHFLRQHPAPDFSFWSHATDPQNRFRQAQLAFFRYYHSNQLIWHAYYYAHARLPPLQAVLRNFDAYREQIRDDLLDAWKLHGPANDQLRLTLDHCLRFSTWESLHYNDLNDKQKLELVEQWVLSISQKGELCQI